MNRIAIFATAVAIAAVPAAVGLAGNASFAQGVSVRVPAHALLLSDDGSTHRAEPGDDRSATPTTTPSASATSDDKGGQSAHAEPGDDKGGSSAHAEPGDDKGGSTKATRTSDDGSHHSSSGATRSASASPSDDKGGHSGSGSSGSGSHGGGSNDGSGHK